MVSTHPCCRNCEGTDALCNVPPYDGREKNQIMCLECFVDVPCDHCGSKTHPHFPTMFRRNLDGFTQTTVLCDDCSVVCVDEKLGTEFYTRFEEDCQIAVSPKHWLLKHNCQEFVMYMRYHIKNVVTPYIKGSPTGATLTVVLVLVTQEQLDELLKLSASPLYEDVQEARSLLEQLENTRMGAFSTHRKNGH